MSTSRALRALLLCPPVLALTFAATTATARAHDDDRHDPRREAKREQVRSGMPIPIAASPNVRLVDTFPETLAISGAFAKRTPHFYVSSVDTVSVYDVSDPKNPSLTGTLPNALFENEAMNYGERKANDRLEQFVLLGVDGAEWSPTDPSHVGTGGEVVVVDVSDPTNPHIRSRLTGVPNSTHTVSCVDDWDCRYAYTAGSAGRFSVIDLRDLDNPKVLRTLTSPAAKSAFDAGHKWNFDRAGYGFHTGGGGTAVFDVRDPANPVPVNGTNAQGTYLTTPWNDFIHHNSYRPNASKFSAGARPSVEKGNVVLVTEEDYENPDCSTAGSFQSWYLPDLNGSAYRAGNPTLEPGKGTMRPLDLLNPVQVGDGLSAPVGGFCSAHWFDYHQSGIVAIGFYQQGLRFIDVRDAANLSQHGYWTTGLSEVWDAYWVPQRNDRGVATGKKTNLVYAVDFIRGLDVLEVDLPKDETDSDPTLPLDPLVSTVTGSLL